MTKYTINLSIRKTIVLPIMVKNLLTECPYRSIDGTYTSKNTPEMPVQVPLMDLYGHLTHDAISHV